MDKRLRSIWETDEPMYQQDVPFGGFDVFMFGDFRQLQPVGASPMYASTKNLRHSTKMSKQTKEVMKQGKKAYRSFKQIITLKSNKRQKFERRPDETDTQAARREKKAEAFRIHLDRMGDGILARANTYISVYKSMTETPDVYICVVGTRAARAPLTRTKLRR